MGRLSYVRTYSGTFYVPTAVKCITYYAVGGGGGGACPTNLTPNANFRSPTDGGATCICGAGVCGGGGKAGCMYSSASGGSSNWRNGQNGYYATSPNSRAAAGYGPYGSGGAGQWRSPNQSYGGGGGGASCKLIARGSNGAIPGQAICHRIGAGGQQGGQGFCRYGEAGAFYACVCTYEPPVPSISASPQSFRANGSDGSDGTVDLTWSTSGGESDSEVLEAVRNGVVVQNLGQVDRNRNSTNPFVVSPTQTTCYRLTTSNPAFSASDTVTVTVYIEPVVTLTADNETIIRGQSTRLRWNTTGDASTLVIEPGVGTSQLSSNALVSPTITTLYTATASGLGGVGSAEVLITVLQPPTIFVSGPTNILYNSNIPLSISATNAPGGITAVATYYFTDGTSQEQSVVSIPNSSGDEVEINGYDFQVNYNDFGPERIFIVFTVDGYGDLIATDTIEIPVTIDEMPDFIEIPETGDVVRNEEPVITPDEEVTTQQIVINDIDIPVEIKADLPIQVEIDNDENWLNVREI